MTDPPDGLAAFERRLQAIPWFVSAGAPLVSAERHDARLYLSGLGLPATPIESAADWPAARAITQREDWDPSWWEAEDAERRRLTEVAEAAAGRDALHRRLTGIDRLASDAIHGAAALALARSNIADTALARSVAGAATQAVHQAGLAIAASAPTDHPFAIKLRLYEAGHWPLGRYGNAFFIL